MINQSSFLSFMLLNATKSNLKNRNQKKKKSPDAASHMQNCQISTSLKCTSCAFDATAVMQWFGTVHQTRFAETLFNTLTETLKNAEAFFQTHLQCMCDYHRRQISTLLYWEKFNSLQTQSSWKPKGICWIYSVNI